MGAYFSGVGEFVDATERIIEEKRKQLEEGRTENYPESSLQPGTFTDDRYEFDNSILNLIYPFLSY